MITEQEVKAKMEERFWSKIKFDTPDKCWIWTASSAHGDYGCYRVLENGKWRTKMATRLMYEAMVSDFDKKLDCLHHCDNPPCVNPNHLWVGTEKDNVADMMRKGRGAPMPGLFGSAHGMAKLNEEQVVEIKNRLKNKECQYEIAEHYNVSAAIISHIHTGRVWNHIKV